MVEIKGDRGLDAQEKASTMKTYWVPGVNYLGTHGRWPACVQGIISAVANPFPVTKPMHAEVFLDTNILLYAYDVDAGEKRALALDIVERGWLRLSSTAISVQVLQELYVNLLRKGRTHEEAFVILLDLSLWPVVETTLPLLHTALEVKERWQTSFWDALIIAAAKEAGATTLISEDLNHGQDYGGVRIQNPFRPAAA